MQRCHKTGVNGVRDITSVETVRRYSKQPHMWRSSKRLAKLLTSSSERSELTHALPHVHKLHQRLSDETAAMLVRDYKSGASLADLQQTYSLSRGSVQQLLREAGVRRRRRSLTDSNVSELVERYESGLTIREIASQQELPKTTVQDALARAGVVMRQAARRVICPTVSDQEDQGGSPY
jgi:uncharacterized protein (DUF433 family)